MEPISLIENSYVHKDLILSKKRQAEKTNMKFLNLIYSLMKNKSN